MLLFHLGLLVNQRTDKVLNILKIISSTVIAHLHFRIWLKNLLGMKSLGDVELDQTKTNAAKEIQNYFLTL